ncbi:MAG: hypothetical protein K8U57_28710 [Planctomycetes bacterium]|nr:hypothetical protein [Planctomycetota bacterium]
MNAPFILVICIANVFCLAPLSIYLFYLAILARRDRPTVISGPWDFAGLTVGLSGFFVFGGGIVLSLLQSNFRYWLRGNLEAFRAAWGSEKTAWMVISTVYFLGIVCGIALTLAARRRSLVVYNIEPIDFESAIVDVFEQLGRPLERRGNLWAAGVPLFELDSFEGGRTVTLRWVAEDLVLFQEAERLLRQAARNLAAHENPVSPWLTACAGGAGFWAAGSFALLLVYFFSLK